MQPGDTLFAIAIKYNFTTETLLQYNALNDTTLYPGQNLRIPNFSIHQVEPGETLSYIAYKYGISIEELKDINNLEDDTILVGQEIILQMEQNILPGREYEVQRGDSLWSIARNFSINMDQLRDINNINNDKILEGMLLKLPFNASATTQKAQAFFCKPFSENLEKGPWFNQPPVSPLQIDENYSETSINSISEDYRLSRQVLTSLDRDIHRAGLLDRDLRGWTIVLDPGHGGLDPGAIVETIDGMGNTAFVVEDEYSYDIAVRLYSLLKQHGADSYLTILSPNHHIRSTPDASSTFVNQKNEVYNSPDITRRPRGGQDGLSDRLQVLNQWIDPGQDKTLFISLHCDNTPQGNYDSAILYGGGTTSSFEASKELSLSFLPFLGGDVITKEQDLAVFRSNPASASVLLEVRNISSPDNSWILRKETLRNQEVERIFQGILDYSRNH
ncbi:MAG: LysM peptidoglycan-binding domain-containing protein [Spirochaetaceae bacterium]|nr:LysM peptidoglycan-binding domain-containing protein [Spirochaetaceae bacterium]